MSVRGDIEENSNYFRRDIIGWDIVDDDFMTEFEKSQLEYDGDIFFPAKVIEL